MRRTHSTYPLTSALLALTIALSGAGVAWAQGGDDEAAGTLYERGVQALERGDYDKAIGLLSAALDEQKLNIVYLSLGRAYQKAGRCQEATQAFDDALAAPEVSAPDPMTIAAYIKSYRTELEQRCPGTLTVACTTEGLEVYVDTAGPKPCGQAMALKPGEYVVEVRRGGATARQLVTIHAMMATDLALDLDPATTAALDPTPGEGLTLATRAEPQDDGDDLLYGLIWTSAGVIALGGGATLDIVPESAQNTELEAMDFAPVALYTLGATAVIIGVYTLITD